MKIYIINENTCTRLKLFGIDVKNLFIENNCIIVDDLLQADLIIINTCSFLKSKETYFIDFIKNINSNLLSHQKIAIIGCLPSVNKDAIININKDIILFGRDIIAIKKYFNFNNFSNMKATTVKDRLTFRKKMIYVFNKVFLHSKHIEYRLKRNKVCYLQISTGCRGKCTYCSEKFTTRLKSRTIEEILEAIKDGISRGYTLFGLNSDDASAYGKDIGVSLEDLLNKIIEIDKKIYFSIPEFNPNGLTNGVIKCLKNKKFIYITVPIQSGSQKILDLMERPYQIETVKEKILLIRKNNKRLMINTHVIVGFPGENEDDFNQTEDLLKEGMFDRVKVFKYSERPNTKALYFDNKVSEETKEKRKNSLLKVVRRANCKNFSLTNLILNREQL